MAITQTFLTNGNSVTDGVSYATASISPGANRLVIVDVANPRNGSGETTPSGITGAGLTFTKIAEVLDTTNGVCLSKWRAMSGSPSTGALTISFSGSNRNSCYWSVSEFDGVDTGGTNGSAAVVQSASNSNTSGGTTLTATLDAFGSANNGATSAFSWASNSGSVATATPDTGWTEITDSGSVDASSITFALETQWRASNDTTAAVTWSAAGVLLALAIEIKAVTSGASITGSGALTAKIPTSSGSGARGHPGTSAAVSFSGKSLAGSGVRGITGSGNPTSRVPTVASTQGATKTGSGAITQGSVTSSGTGAKGLGDVPGPITLVQGTPATVSGVANIGVPRTGSGSISSSKVAASGTAAKGRSASATLISSRATLAGTAAIGRALTGAGAMSTAPMVITSASVFGHVGTGAISGGKGIITAFVAGASTGAQQGLLARYKSSRRASRSAHGGSYSA